MRISRTATLVLSAVLAVSGLPAAPAPAPPSETTATAEAAPPSGTPAAPAPAHPSGLQGANWVWHAGDLARPGQQPPECSRFFRKAFELETAPNGEERASLVLTADNEWTVFLNGRLVGEGEKGTAAWHTPGLLDVTDQLRPGPNVLAVQATNILPGPAGLLLRLTVPQAESGVVRVDTDGSWVASAEGGGGWHSLGFDDTKWAAVKVLAPFGEGAWGTGVSAPRRVALAEPMEFGEARWIWYHPDLDEPGESPPACTRFFRAVLDVPGTANVRRAEVIMTADNEWGASLNGRVFEEGPQGSGAWEQPRRLDVTGLVTPGRNVLAVEATNILPGPAALLLKFRVSTKDGEVLERVTDAEWKVVDVPPKGWREPGFDDSGWQNAHVVAPFGKGPWGTRPRYPVRAPLANPPRIADPGVPGAVVFVQGNVPKPHHFAFSAQGADGRLRSFTNRAFPESDIPSPSVPGRRLLVLDAPRPGAEPRVLVDAGKGTLGSPAVSYDGKSVLFSMAPEGDGFYHLYRVPAAGGEVEQLTHGPFQDYDPEPLPDGRIAFSSTRIGSREEYHCNLASSIFAMQPDGSAIEPLTYHIVADREPRVTAHGSLVVVRSDNFLDRAKVETQLHHLHLDGTAGSVLLGNDRGAIGYNPAFATEGPVHPPLLRHNGFGSPAPLPDGRVAALSRDGLVVGGVDVSNGRQVATTQQLFDVSSLPDGRLLATTLDRKYLGVVDVATGGFTAFHVAATRNVHSVVFLGARTRPATMASALRNPQDRARDRTGFLYCQSVFNTKQAHMDLSRVRAVRVYEGVPVAIRPDHYPYVHVGVEAIELGTVPLSADGSFYAEVPADRALALQAVDAEGRGVINEMTWIYVRPGERRSCVGCHSQRPAAPPPGGFPKAALARPVRLLGKGRPYRFRGNNPELGGVFNLQFDRFREAAGIDLYPEPFPMEGAEGTRVSAREAVLTAAATALAGSDPERRTSAAQRLAVLRDRCSAPALVAAMEDPEPAVRMNAALALAGCGDRATIRPLLQALLDPDGRVAAAAHLALSNLTGCGVDFDASAPTRERGADAWVAALSPGLQPVVSARLEELAASDRAAAFRAARALGHIGGEQGGGALRAYVEAHLDPNAAGADARTLMDALRALGRIADAGAIPLLARILSLDTQRGHGHVRRRNVHVASAAAEALGQIGSPEAERVLLDFCPKLRGFRDYTLVSGDHPVLINCHSSVLHYRILEALDTVASTDASVLPVFLRSLPEDLDRALLLETDSYENLVGWMAQRCGAADRLAETCLAVLGDHSAAADGTLREALEDNPVPASHRSVPLKKLFRSPRNGLTFLPYVPEMRAAQVLSVLPASVGRAARVSAVYERYRDEESPDGREGYAGERTRAWVCFYLARYLGRLGGAEATRALQRSLDQLPPELAAGRHIPPHPMAYTGVTPFHRAAAAYSLGRAGGSGGIPILLKVIADLGNAVDVRHSAARGLSLAAGPEHREALARLTADYPEVATRRLLQDACARASRRP